MRGSIARIVYKILVRPWLTYIIGVKFVNRSTFDNLEQFIVVANHNSHFDTVSIMAALPGSEFKKTSAVAAIDYFGKNSFSKSLMKFFFNAVLISRNRQPDEPSALDILDKKLKEGRSLVLFPEGSRGKPGVITDFKKGIALLLKQNPTIPFVPVYLDGFGRVLPKDQWLIIPLVCKVRFGEPLYAEGEDVDSILDEVKEEILKLRNEDERDRNQFDL